MRCKVHVYLSKCFFHSWLPLLMDPGPAGTIGDSFTDYLLHFYQPFRSLFYFIFKFLFRFSFLPHATWLDVILLLLLILPLYLFTCIQLILNNYFNSFIKPHNPHGSSLTPNLITPHLHESFLCHCWATAPSQVAWWSPEGWASSGRSRRPPSRPPAWWALKSLPT